SEEPARGSGAPRLHRVPPLAAHGGGHAPRSLSRLTGPMAPLSCKRFHMEEDFMRTLKGPAIFLAQFAGDTAPFDTLDNICGWAAGLGYKGVQIPTWVPGFIDLKKAAESKSYCDELKGIAGKHGVEITELSTHLQGQLVAVHPAYDTAFDGF